MTVVVVNHFMIFASPLVYLTGKGKLWTTAAEMFFLLSGLTLGIVRSQALVADFWGTTKRMWSRAARLYLVGIAVIFISLLMSYLAAKVNLNPSMPEPLPGGGLYYIVIKVLSLRLLYGWADFLMYYTVILIFTPFALYALHKRYWPAVPAVSVALFILTVTSPIKHNPYEYFLVWQVYFFAGLTIARHRLALGKWYSQLTQVKARALRYGVVAAAALATSLSVFMSFKTQAVVDKITAASWTPRAVKDLATSLLRHQPFFEHWLQQNRSGLLRPIFTLLIFAAAYFLYQKLSQPLLKYSGSFFNVIGANSLYVFILQALLIPPLSLLPLPHNMIVGSLVSAILLGSLWYLAKKRLFAKLVSV